jgi:hypothetical protein
MWRKKREVEDQCVKSEERNVEKEFSKRTAVWVVLGNERRGMAGWMMD